MFSEKPEIALIGAGKFAYSFTDALIKSGFIVKAVINKKKKSADLLAGKFKIPFSSNSLKSLTPDIKVIFLTTPDSEIKKTALAIAKLKLDFKNLLFIHVSGALNMNELDPLRKMKGNIASFHIMQTFPSKRIVNIKGCAVAIESPKKSVKDFLKRIADKLELKPFYLKPGEKIYYHLAGIFTSNFLAGNLFTAEKMFKKGNDKIKFLTVFGAIINSTLGNIKAVGSANALSGPVERGDYETIGRHLKALKKEDKVVFKNYIIQSLNLLEAVKEKNKSLSKEHRRIKRLLERFPV